MQSKNQIIRKILDFIIHFIRRILYFVTAIIGTLICHIIFLVTFEPGKWKQVTKRKIHRIRALTKFKLWMYDKFGWYFRFIHDYKYYEKLKERLG